MSFIVAFTAAILFALVRGNDELCEVSAWNVIRGVWEQKGQTCVYLNSDSQRDNILWFGSKDGLVSNKEYVDSIFTMAVDLTLRANEGNAGVIFRATTVSKTINAGKMLYVSLDPVNDKLIFGKIDSNENTELYAYELTINPSNQYRLRVEAVKDEYSVFLNGNALVSQYSKAAGFIKGSIGLRTFLLPTIYQNLMYSSNALCLTNRWNAIKGTWRQNSEEVCTFVNTDTGPGNVLWLGSENGEVPDAQFVDSKFTVDVSLKLSLPTGDAGILIRALTVESQNFGGRQYYVYLDAGGNRVVVGKIDGGSFEEFRAVEYTVKPDIVYQLKVEADGSSYNVYVDGLSVLSFERTLFSAGSIGLRTYHNPTVFSNVEYEVGEEEVVKVKKNNVVNSRKWKQSVPVVHQKRVANKAAIVGEAAEETAVESVWYLYAIIAVLVAIIGFGAAKYGVCGKAKKEVYRPLTNEENYSTFV